MENKGKLIQTEETSTSYKTRWECRINDERPTGKKGTIIEWDDGGKISNTNKIYSNWNLPIGAWKMIFKSIDVTLMTKNLQDKKFQSEDDVIIKRRYLTQLLL